MLTVSHSPYTKVFARLAHFATDERGTVALNRIFAGLVVFALATTVTAMLVFGSDTPPPEPPNRLEQQEAAFRAAHGGLDRGMVLADGPRNFFTREGMRTRYDLFSNPNNRTDTEVRDAHRTWVRRAADHAYSQPGRALDMVLILEQALIARGLEPHRRM